MKAHETDKGKHLTVEDRHFIEDALNENSTLKSIAERLFKDPTTISKEIKRNRIAGARPSDNFPSRCKHHKECRKMELCNTSCKRLCKKCTTLNCYKICPDYEAKKCLRVNKFPHVCNGCKQKISCHHQKYNYRAKVAHTNYKEVLTTCREGIGMSPTQMKELDELVSPLIKKGQSIAHIYAHHRLKLGCSERTLYNYFEMNAFSARNIDLPRKVRYKPRKKAQATKACSAYRIGRTYEDFTAYTALNPEKSVVEMDTVIGRKGGKTLLTLLFRNCSLMLAFLLDANTQEQVISAMNAIYQSLGYGRFKACFPIILTDNGSEFKDPDALEKDELGNDRTKVFYCEPMASYQKPHIEKNHEYIRYILPKGKSFDHLTQEKVTLMMNHINSTSRLGLNRQTPYKLAELLLGESFLESLSLRPISSDEVHLKPALLK